MVFPYSRFVCDAERLENDPLEEKGQGIIYKEYDGHKRNDMTEKQIKETLRYGNNTKRALKNILKAQTLSLSIVTHFQVTCPIVTYVLDITMTGLIMVKL